MNRRAFVQAVALCALAVRRAFADTSLAGAKTKPAPPSKRFGEAIERARKAGKPLLVFIIPEADGQKWERGRAFGEWLNHGSDAQLAPLALVEVACLGLGEIERVYDGPTDPLMLLVDPKDEAPMLILHADLPEYAERNGIIIVGSDGKAPPHDDDETVFQKRVAILSKLVADAVTPGALPAGRTPTLAQTVKTKLRDRPPPGAHWATGGGCGTTVEQTPEEKEAEERQRKEELKRGVISMKTIVAVGCGMGHVPEKSRRFLYLFAKGPYET